MNPEEYYLRSVSKWLKDGERIRVRETISLNAPVVTRMADGCRLTVCVTKRSGKAYLVGVRKDGVEVLL